MQFRPVEHAITEDGEWVTPEELSLNYRGRLLCDSCHAEIVIEEDRSGNEMFVHSRLNRSERVKNQNCRYAISPSKPPAKTGIGRKGNQPPAGYAALRGPLNTRIGSGRCTRCEHTYYGSKKCPRCGDWVYSITR